MEYRDISMGSEPLVFYSAKSLDDALTCYCSYITAHNKRNQIRIDKNTS